MADPRWRTYVSQLRTGDWLGDLIDRHHDFGDLPDRWIDPDPFIHPSASGGACARSYALGFLGHRPAGTFNSPRRRDNGTDAHVRWTRYFNEIGVLWAGGLRLTTSNPLYWSGESDLIVRNPKTGALHVGEIKTMHSQRYARVPDQSGDWVDMAKRLQLIESHYVSQLVQYVWMLNLKLGTSMEAFFLFENTDNQDYKLRWLRVDEELVDRVVEPMAQGQRAALRGKLMKAPFGKRSQQCTNCRARRLCFDLQAGKVDAVQAVNDAVDRLRFKELPSEESILISGFDNREAKEDEGGS